MDLEQRHMLYPLKFLPIFKERIWGGRELERRYGKPLPPGVPVGESWEISDRPHDISIVANGPLLGKDLHWLVAEYGPDLLGKARLQSGRFPLLIKILDARDKLSLQVHPPARQAALLGGEPKTEMWYVAAADPGAELFVGLRQGVTREEFARKVGQGTVAECFHRVAVRAGDSMFLPSGRVHAIGGGLVIFEIQQNSDTTFRVFDWNRRGADGKPRALHISESLQSINFNDFEPALSFRATQTKERTLVCKLAEDPLFSVHSYFAPVALELALVAGRMRILAAVCGEVLISSSAGEPLRLGAGEFGLIPATLESVLVRSKGPCTLLLIEAGEI